MYKMLIVKDWNYLATHLKKLATHKCVATPWLRTTAIEGHETHTHVQRDRKELAEERKKVVEDTLLDVVI
jgi:hypothetical protein